LKLFLLFRYQVIEFNFESIGRSGLVQSFKSKQSNSP